MPMAWKDIPCDYQLTDIDLRWAWESFVKNLDGELDQPLKRWFPLKKARRLLRQKRYQVQLEYYMTGNREWSEEAPWLLYATPFFDVEVRQGPSMAELVMQTEQIPRVMDRLRKEIARQPPEGEPQYLVKSIILSPLPIKCNDASWKFFTPEEAGTLMGRRSAKQERVWEAGQSLPDLEHPIPILSPSWAMPNKENKMAKGKLIFVKDPEPEFAVKRGKVEKDEQGQPVMKRAMPYHHFEGSEVRIYRVVVQKAMAILTKYPKNAELLEDPGISGLGEDAQKAIKAGGMSIPDFLKAASVDIEAATEENKKNPKKQAYKSKTQDEKETVELARVICAIAPQTSAKNNADRLVGLMDKYKDEAVALADGWFKENGRTKTGHIAERKAKK